MNLAVSGGGRSTQVIYLKEEILHYKNTPLLQPLFLRESTGVSVAKCKWYFYGVAGQDGAHSFTSYILLHSRYLSTVMSKCT